ncbi:hypothetical protein KFL_011020020 [Klebsormidium nitens]|uniref:Uncharacterized protein n=1 Tax=Klebsormidium nitens TaxID=105231 RepID=A0A1Y1IT32_KLENI|nr:hypothetical protein KFL_011020020 [Klebsormidium nitens]|eukprot:GAQ92709.1 hypothetical protein KFL_011020020 [Klebsormidium nitens]
MAAKMTQKNLFAMLKEEAKKKLPNRNDRKRGRDSSGPVVLNEKQCKLANLTGAKPSTYKKKFTGGWRSVDDFLTNQKKVRERYYAKHNEDPASGDLKWLLDQLGVAYDHNISQKAAIRLWVDHTSGIRVWQAASLSMEYSIGPDDWKDLTNEQAESILEKLQEDPANRDPRNFDDEPDEDYFADDMGDAADFDIGGSVAENLAALDDDPIDDDLTLSQLTMGSAKKPAGGKKAAGSKKASKAD